MSITRREEEEDGDAAASADRRRGWGKRCGISFLVEGPLFGRPYVRKFLRTVVAKTYVKKYSWFSMLFLKKYLILR